MAELVIISPELGRGAGGVADYTLRVVEHWPSETSFRFLVPSRGAQSGAQVAGHEVQVVERDSASISAQLPANGGKILLQYSAYGFDHFGYPRWLLRALTEWKQRSRGLLVIMFHEIWTFWPILNKNYFVQQLHRRDIRALLAEADAVFTSTASQAEHLQQLAPDTHVDMLPVGSNVQPVRTPIGDREAGVAVLFGLQGTRRRTLEVMQADLFALAQQKVIVKVITVGAGDDTKDVERERAILERLKLRDGFEQRGTMGEQHLSELFLDAQFGISSQDNLSLTKSGTFMAYVAHGLNVISPAARAEAEPPFCWLTAPGDLLRDIPLSELRARSEHLRDWQERNASWTHIAGEFARALQMS